MLKSINLRALPELDTIRFIAIFLVLLHHLHIESNPVLNWFNRFGWVGVDIFFVMSGFLITQILEAEFINTHRIDLKKFWGRRIRRLWPSYLLVLVLTMIMVFFLSRQQPKVRQALAQNWWHYFLHFGNYSQIIFGRIHTLFNHFWSLAVEEHFYLVWPILLLALLKRRSGMMIILTFLMVIPYFLRIMHWSYPNAEQFVTFATHSRFDELIMGCFLALSFKRFTKLNAYVESVLWCLIIATFYIGLHLFHESTEGASIRELDSLFIGLGSCLLIIVSLKGSETGIRRILRHPFLARLGILSYGVYLTHLMCNFVIFALWPKTSSDISVFLQPVVHVIVPFVPAYFLLTQVDARFKSKP